MPGPGGITEMRLKHIIRLSIILVCFNVSALSSGAELTGVRQELKKDIERAQKELSATEEDISKEREELARRINKARARSALMPSSTPNIRSFSSRIHLRPEKSFDSVRQAQASPIQALQTLAE